MLLSAVHACGPLSDAVLARAAAGGSAAAVMPCCHSLRKQRLPDLPGITLEVRPLTLALSLALTKEGQRRAASIASASVA